MGEGCNEKLDREFIGWVLHGQRTRKAKERYAQVYAQYGDKVIVVKNQRKLDECQRKLEQWAMTGAAWEERQARQ